MKTTVDNNQRVFLINQKGFFTNYYFCNLQDIPKILKEELKEDDKYTVSEYWKF